MLTHVHGDILTPNQSDTPTIVCHQVNCRGVMGSGLAKQIRAKFPNVYDAYKQQCFKFEEKNLGQCLLCNTNEMAGFKIANLFGQNRYGTDKRYTDYDALRQCLAELRGLASGYVVRIPYRLGCGLGGGDWSIVRSLIIEELVNHNITVEIWEL